MFSHLLLLATLAASPTRTEIPAMETIAVKIRELRKSGQDPLAGLSIVYSIESDDTFANVQETRDVLTVDGNGVATHLRTNDQRSPGTPPGKWSGTVARADLEAFVKRLEIGGIDLPSGGDAPPLPSEPYELLRLRVGGIERSIGRRGFPMEPKPCGFDDLRPFLQRWAEACKKPLWKIALAIVDPRLKGKHLHATVRFSNAGNFAVAIPHPASPASDDALRLSLFHFVPPVTKKGVTPLPPEIDIVPIELPRKSQLEWITIGPNSAWDFPLDYDLPAPPPASSHIFIQYRAHAPIPAGKTEAFQGTVTSTTYRP